MATRMQVLAPLGTVVAVVGVVAAVTLLNPGGRTHSPRVLQLASGSAAPKSAASDSRAGGAYKVTGRLPSGTPADAAAWTFDAAGSARVAELATALHTTKAAVQISDGSSRQWTYSACAGETSVSSDGASTCAVASPGVAVGPGTGSGTSSSSGSGPAVADAPVRSPMPIDGIGRGKPLASPPPAVPKDVMVKAATPVFAALGLDVSQATVDTSPYGGSAVLNPLLSGLDTVGFTTSVSMDASGKVRYASGFLGDPTMGDSYPVISAQQAFDELPAFAHLDLCRLPAAGEPAGCGAPPALEITGAHLGLLMQPLAGNDEALVPAWLFEVQGSDYPISQVAVAKKYLATDPVPTPNASDQPLPSAVAPANPSTPLSVDAASRGAKPNELVVQYGDSSSCPWQHVTHKVKEDSTTIYMLLQADPRKPGIACTADYLPRKVTVELQSPLADRKVVDATTAKAVPVA